MPTTRPQSLAGAHVLAIRLAVLLFAWLAGPLFTNETLAQEPLQPGEGFITRFSGTTRNGSGEAVIDLTGTVGTIVDLRNPAQPPRGQHWLNEPQRNRITAAETGQVFGIALDDAEQPNIYIAATSAFGLHRTADNLAWMEGMWGPRADPGAVWKLDAANGYTPSLFATIKLDGRENTGAGLGNLAYDRWNKQLYVSDLESGMVHRLRLTDGADLGRFDHGVDGRARFLDAVTGQTQSLPQARFDPATAAKIKDCVAGEFSRTPACWNFADFRRRVWGLGVRKDADSGEVRLYYAVWSSEGFGNPDFAGAATEDKTNSLWSVAIAKDGAFDLRSVRREALLPDFFTDPGEIARAGKSHPVTDIAFPQCSASDVMLVAERGGVRNLGLDAEDPFATPHESRALRYQLDDKGVWRLSGRYDVGFDDRKGGKPPFIRASSCGGIDFGYGYREDWSVDLAKPDEFVWINGDGLCSPRAPCFVPEDNKRIDGSYVDGSHGTPEFAFSEVLPPDATKPYPPSGDPYPPTGPTQSWMIDIDTNIDASGGPAMDSLTANHATMIGDIAIYQPCEADLPIAEEPPLVEEPPGIEEPPVIEAPPIVEGPDLEKVKTGPAQCTEGAICTFTITITNKGPGEWSGPLWELDTLPPGAILVDYRPQPDWLCNQVGGDVVCNQGWATVAPGAAVTLEMDVFIPGGTAGQVVENCVSDIWLPSFDPNDPAAILAIEQALAGLGYPVGPIDGLLDIVTMNAIAQFQFANGLPQTAIPDQALIDLLFGGTAGLPGDLNPTNDRDCHQVEILPALAAPVLAPPDLEVRKLQTTGRCQPGGLCTFRLIFINRGPGDWTGAPELTDTLPPGATLVNPPVGCTQSGDTVTCRYPQAINAPPNSPGSVTITIRLPANLAPGAQNCVALPLTLVPDDPNPGNNRACIKLRVAPAPVPDLRVLKIQTGGHCTPGEACAFDLWLINRGPGSWTGTPQLSDELPPNAKFKDASAPWICQQSDRTVACTHDKVTVPPGRGVKLSLTADLPEDLAPNARNCVRKGDGITQDPVPANDEHCVAILTAPAPPSAPPHAEEPIPAEPIEPEAPPPAPPSHTRVEKKQAGPCTKGRSCLFELKFINDGPETWTGKAKLTDLLPDAGVNLGTWSQSAWQCAKPWARSNSEGAAIACEHSGATLAPGQHLSLTLALQLPEHLMSGAQNCVALGAAERKGAGVPDETEALATDPNLIGERYCVTIDFVTPGSAPHAPAAKQPDEPCPEGTVKQGGQCVTLTLTCPKGYVLKGKTCYSTKLTCPKGYVLKGKRCYSTRPSCPRGYVLRGNRCYPITIQRACPPGTFPVGNACIRITIPPPRGGGGGGHGHDD